MELIDPEDAAKKLRQVLPQLDEAETVRRLSLKKQFVYIARDISPVQEIAINNLGIPGIYFEPGERRHYPLGRTAAQVMGGVDIDDHGVAGVERYFDQRLNSDRTPSDYHWMFAFRRSSEMSFKPRKIISRPSVPARSSWMFGPAKSSPWSVCLISMPTILVMPPMMRGSIEP